MKNLLVIGARPGSIGDAVVREARIMGGYSKVITAGISGEDISLSLDRPLDARQWIEDVFNETHEMHDVVCTVGVNDDGTLRDPYTLRLLDDAFHINVLAPLVLMEAWLTYWRSHDIHHDSLHFAVISSNSAQVPRSTGLPYCTTKAALSAAVRCVARSEAAVFDRLSVYAYEPGWVAGTPMSNDVTARLPKGVAPTRTPGGRMIKAQDLASIIVNNLRLGTSMLNGCTIRIDGGEA